LRRRRIKKIKYLLQSITIENELVSVKWKLLVIMVYSLSTPSLTESVMAAYIVLSVSPFQSGTALVGKSFVALLERIRVVGVLF
jgi:hypothetical protein